MRYIDSGSRNPDHALGTWLSGCAARAADLSELRVQSGFFSAGSLAFLDTIFARAREIDGILRVLVGSNDGATRSSDMESLLSLVGPARQNLSVGVVSYARGFFHPKTVHIAWQDGSACAYVGSANLTGDGVASLHVEAGLLLDSGEGDDKSVLDDIAATVDAWFAESRPGLYLVGDSTDLVTLVADGILDAPRPAQPRNARGSGTEAPTSLARLSPLVAPPRSQTANDQAGAAITTPPEPANADPPGGVQVVALWSKPLSASDAQRKMAGNQRGSITLVQAGHDIDPQTFFRTQFFSTADWTVSETRTGEVLEYTEVLFRVTVLGDDLGLIALGVTYSLKRADSPGNYTSLLHLGPLASVFADTELTGRTLELARLSNGTFLLSIT